MSVKYTCIYKYGGQGIVRHIPVTFHYFESWGIENKCRPEDNL